jgi:hypothetical protein
MELRASSVIGSSWKLMFRWVVGITSLGWGVSGWLPKLNVCLKMFGLLSSAVLGLQAPFPELFGTETDALWIKGETKYLVI